MCTMYKNYLYFFHLSCEIWFALSMQLITLQAQRHKHIHSFIYCIRYIHITCRCNCIQFLHGKCSIAHSRFSFFHFNFRHSIFACCCCMWFIWELCVIFIWENAASNSIYQKLNEICIFQCCGLETMWVYMSHQAYYDDNNKYSFS